MRLGASVVWHPSLPLMNSFDKTEAAFFLVQDMLPGGFPFQKVNLTYYCWYSVPVRRL